MTRPLRTAGALAALAAAVALAGCQTAGDTRYRNAPVEQWPSVRAIDAQRD